MGAREPWNLNIHYHRVFHEAIPPGARTALDVGSGNGLLSFELAARGLDVVGIDTDRPSIDRARSDPRAAHGVEFICGDVFSHELEPASFDLVAASAMLHHVDARRALKRLKELVRPGGALVIVGFARPSGFADRAMMVAGQLRKRVHIWNRSYWEHDAPTCWPPPTTMTEMYELVSRELPGAQFRRAMSQRFTVVWDAPPRQLPSRPLGSERRARSGVE